MVLCSRPRYEREELFYIRVADLPKRVTNTDLIEWYSKFGPIQHVELHKGAGKGHCYIGYQHLSQAVFAHRQGRIRAGHQLTVEILWNWPLIDPEEWLSKAFWQNY